MGSGVHVARALAGEPPTLKGVGLALWGVAAGDNWQVTSSRHVPIGTS